MIFENATIITMNTKRHIITNGAVVTDGKNISAVGKTREIIERFPEESRIDCNGGILMPGLVDTHVHISQTMLRGLLEGDGPADFFDWLVKYIWPMQGNFTHEDGLASASLTVLEMLKSGTTGFIEVLLGEPYGFDGIAEMCARSGIRACLGRTVMDPPAEVAERIGMHPGMWEKREDCIPTALDAFDRWNGAGEGRIQVWFGARTPGENNRPSLYDELGRLASERGMGITVHLSEMPEDIAYARSQGFRSPTEFAHAHGLLGPRTIFAHYIETDAADWELVAKTGTNVSHNPASNAKEGWPVAPVSGMLAAGVNVTLGCDGGPVNNAMDLMRDLRLVSYAARIREQTPKLLPPETVLEMAVLNGYRAIGLSGQAGVIQPGMRADFIIIDTDKPHFEPMWNPAAAVVYAASGADVDTIVIDGQVIMQARKVLTIDEDAVLEDVRRRYHDLARRTGVDIRPIWPVL
jgi:cytosine/adenosine deaminase-related metal-dependent hydrolase